MEQSDSNVPHEEAKKKKPQAVVLAQKQVKAKPSDLNFFNDYSSRKMKVYKTEYQLDNH